MDSAFNLGSGNTFKLDNLDSAKTAS